MTRTEKPLFSNRRLFTIILPLLLEQYLAILVGLADTVMVSSVGEHAVSGVSLVNNLSAVMLNLFTALAAGGGIVTSQFLGAKRTDELKNLFKKSNILTAIVGVGFAILSFALAEPLAKFFLGTQALQNNPQLISMTVNAFRYFSVAMLFCGFSIFGSAFFTALNNGLVSAIISFLRMFLFQVVCVLVLPLIFDIDGIWYSMFVSEFLAVIVTFVLFGVMRKKYDY